MAEEIAIVAFAQTPSYRTYNDSEPSLILGIVNQILEEIELDRHEIDFTIAGSCDYLLGLPSPSSRTWTVTVPGRRSIPASTSSASASCGIHRGLTKLVASTTGRRAELNRFINSILIALSIN